jgi:hypothetical protein
LVREKSMIMDTRKIMGMDMTMITDMMTSMSMNMNMNMKMKSTITNTNTNTNTSMSMNTNTRKSQSMGMDMDMDMSLSLKTLSQLLRLVMDTDIGTGMLPQKRSLLTAAVVRKRMTNSKY